MFDAKVVLEKYSRKKEAMVQIVLTCSYTSGKCNMKPITLITKEVRLYQIPDKPEVLSTDEAHGANTAELEAKFFGWIGEAVYQDFKVTDKFVSEGADNG